MRAEKGGSKSSGFFNLFDWNRKSRKKLFTISPEGSKIGRRIEEPILPSCLRMMDEEEAMAISSIKGSSDYSCASSINSDDLNGSKPAGVVARLMGLDSLPVSALSDLNSTPFNSFRDPIINNNNNYNINNNNHNNYARKMPSSPIERFQMEALPSNRSVKSLPNNYHNKLLSPIKNPNFVYGRNASQIMEAAAKIIESSNNNNSSSSNMREKVCLTGRVNGLRVDPLRSDKGSSRLLRMNQGFERGLNREEDIVIIRSSSPDSYEENNNINININNSNNINLGSSNNNSGLSGRGNKGKSVSLAIQAKVNVQKREGVNLSNRNYGSVHRESGTGNCTGTSNQRTGMIKQQKKGSTGTGSSSPVLRQNNQKQNCIGNRAGKSGSGKSTQSQQARKSETLNSTRQKSRLSSNLKPRKENFEFSNSNESRKDFPQKKRLIDRTNNSTNNNNNNNNINNNNNVNVNTKGKNSVLVDEYTKFNKETKDTTDVVSFTFTSPLLKQTGDSSFASQKLGLVTKGNKDALSLLLENKLRELTNETNEKLIDFGNSDLGFDLRGKEIERNLGFEFEFEEREKDGVFDFSNDQSFRVMEKGECSKKNDIYEYEENKQLSPFSVFGEESCSTSESSNSIDGSKVSSSSVQAQNTSASSKNFLSSPSQLDTSSTKLFRISKFNNPELDYITDIISNTDLENMFLEGVQLDSPFFDKLERKRSRTELENDDSSSSSLSLNDRRLLYDCVKECLGNKLEVNFINKGIFSRGERIFPMNKEVYGQIEGWRKMRDLDVDEVVERDMVVKKDYTADSIMICTDLEAEILDSLIEGLVGELM